jgi:hypothetical protein
MTRGEGVETPDALCVGEGSVYSAGFAKNAARAVV